MNLFDILPAKWAAVAVGVVAGSMAIVTITGQKTGFGKAAWSAAGIAPVLCIIAGAMLPPGTSLEIAAMAGGMAALGGTAVIMKLAEMAPRLFGAAMMGVANSYIEMEGRKTTRLREDGTPEADAELDDITRRLDEPNRQQPDDPDGG